MSRERLPIIGSSGNKRTVKLPLSSRAHHQTNHQSRPQHPTSSSSHPHPKPSYNLHSETTITPWEGLALPESFIASIPPPPIPPPPSPAPQPTPSTPYRVRHTEDEEVSSCSFNSEVPSTPVAVTEDHAGGRGRRLPPRQKVFLQRVAHPPRLPPLRPVSNLSFSRSFTFSFFELPLQHSPHCRADRIRNIMLLLKQIHY